MHPFVIGFLQTPAGPVPQVGSRPTARDRLGAILARIGPTRNNYKVTPGLYAVGSPGPESPVLVTANYKLSFDTLRFQLDTMNAWLLVADTRGINVWCAAGKGTFSTEEIIYSVKQCHLQELVSHHLLILPQLGATGVAAFQVTKKCGFKILFGPVRAPDLPAFLKNDNRADEAMRSVTFTLRERAVLIPVELYLLVKPLTLFFLAGILLSGIGPSIFSAATAWTRGLRLMSATLMGIGCGTILVPLILPWLPGRQFWVKGLLPGLAGGLTCWSISAGHISTLENLALLLWVTVVSSYLAMNFTGATPFTSPTGVEHEMRRGIPVQSIATAIGLLLWLSSPFIS
ncbi:MAG: hypothetical protein KKA76_13330 [Proteobacteria bacterium]|nr:hypothetical protein [Pseudomonadota bacterium]